MRYSLFSKLVRRDAEGGTKSSFSFIRHHRQLRSDSLLPRRTSFPCLRVGVSQIVRPSCLLQGFTQQRSLLQILVPLATTRNIVRRCEATIGLWMAYRSGDGTRTLTPDLWINTVRIGSRIRKSRKRRFSAEASPRAGMGGGFPVKSSLP